MAYGLYDGSLESIPGLGGWIQQQKLNNAQDAANIQNAAGLLSVVKDQQSLADAQRVRAILTQGGDPGTVVQSLLQAGPSGIEAAKNFMGVQQLQNSISAMKGLDLSDPAALRRVGTALSLQGHSGGQALLTQADYLENRQAKAAALSGMQDQPTPVTETPTLGVGAPGTPDAGIPAVRANMPVADPISPSLQALLDKMKPGEVNDTPGVVTMKNIPPAVAATLIGLGKPDQPLPLHVIQTGGMSGALSPTEPTQGTGGIALPLTQSPVPVVAQAAQTLQSQLDKITPADAQSFNPQHFLDRVNQLQTQQQNLKNQEQRINISINKEADANVRAGLNPDGTPNTSATALSDSAIAAAAARYRIDGTLPPNLGRGAQGALNTNKILNAAAEQAAAEGSTPEAQRIAQIANKANAAALGQITKQETMLGAFERNALANADLAVAASAKVDRTGVPLINRWIQAGRKEITGDPDSRVFNAANSTFISEYAKIMSGGTGAAATTEGATHRAQDLLSTADTPQAYVAVVNQLKLEMANRMKGIADEKAQLTQGMSPSTPPATSPTRNPQAQALPPNSVQLPDGRVKTFPSPAAAQAFKAAAGL